jgi:DNA-binding transcriptional LysR family regulator
MVGGGLGVALLPHTAVAAELAAGSLRTVALNGTPPIRRRIVAIRRADLGPPAGIPASFLAVLEEIDDVLAERDRPDPAS